MRGALVLGCAVAALVAALTVLGLWQLRAGLPDISSLADYRPPQASWVYSDDGERVGEFFVERRRVVAIEAIPKVVVHAFLAAEDAEFYQHQGLDYLGILRAALKNLRPGAHLQGASTITQQTVKTLVVGAERTYLRKLREALLALRLEQVLKKDEILHLYLNQIYFGSGCYGVETASLRYFGKSVRQLGAGEAAFLAAIPKNPSRYTPLADLEEATLRARWILQQMQAHGWTEVDSLAAPSPANIVPGVGNHYIEETRRRAVDLLGNDALLTGGYTLYLGMHAGMQRAADAATQVGIEELARRHGYPGARLRVEVDRFEEVLRALQEQHAPSTAPWDLSALTAEALQARPPDVSGLRRGVDSRVEGIVTSVGQRTAEVDVGTRKVSLSLAHLQWARSFAPVGPVRTPGNMHAILHKGDVVRVDLDTGTLVPRPLVQVALVAIDPTSGYVRAMVGGYDLESKGLIRASQSRRQPGSAFKPLLYAAALQARAITPVTECADAPVVIHDPWTHEAWKPENHDGAYDGNMPYRQALARSKNTCSVKLIEKLTPQPVLDLARAVGIAGPLPDNLTLALGTGEVTPLELAGAYAALANAGVFVPPTFVRKIVDAAGSVVFEARPEARPVLDSAAAYVTVDMMRTVVEVGTGRGAQALERPVAAKTGTSQDARDAWFSGFTPDLVATVWVGFDDNQPLGPVSGASAALPIWLEFMQRALAGRPIATFARPEGVEAQMQPDGREEVFVPGTVPRPHEEALGSPFLVDPGL
jgi:penicillin-binding protein 1A